MDAEDALEFELPHRTLHPSFIETLPDYFPDIKYEFYKLRDAEGDKKTI